MSRHKSRNRVVLAYALLLVLGAVGLSAYDIHMFLRAAGLLTRISHPTATGFLASYVVYAVDERSDDIQTPHGLIRGRVYMPVGVTNAPGMVVVHGVHRLGIDEPRLKAFARDIAASGIVVFTPQLNDIADYRITTESIDVIGESAQMLGSRVKSNKVGLFGLSFAGGLCLLAAADERYANNIAYVVAVGAHDDLSRVSRFFVTNEIATPDGTLIRREAHEYGTLIIVYEHPDYFFSAKDAPIAKEVMRLEMAEQPDAARTLAKRMTPAGLSKMRLLLEDRRSELNPELLSVLESRRDEMPQVSPTGRLQSLRANVLLLHGTDDAVIPAVETLWLARSVPADRLKRVLITPLLSHVDVGADPPLAEQAALVDFIAEMLRESDAIRPRRDIAARSSD